MISFPNLSWRYGLGVLRGWQCINIRRIGTVPEHLQNHIEPPQSTDNVSQTQPPPKPTIPEWKKRDISLTARYGKWNPTRKVSREHMDNIREMKQQLPELTTKNIADRFGMSPEAIRRILKSKWKPDEDRLVKFKERAAVLKKDSQRRKLQMDMGVEMQEARAKNSTTIPWNEWKLSQDQNKKIVNQKLNGKKGMKNKSIKTSNILSSREMATPVIKYDSRKPSSAYNPNKKRKPKRNPRANIHTTLSGIID